MSESDFVIRAETERGPMALQCNGDNTELYLHRNQFQEVDHIFHRLDDRDRRLGGFIWRHVIGSAEFDTISEHMRFSGDFLVVYRPEPTDSDFNEYLREQSGDIDTWQG